MTASGRPEPPPSLRLPAGVSGCPIRRCRSAAYTGYGLSSLRDRRAPEPEAIKPSLARAVEDFGELPSLQGRSRLADLRRDLAAPGGRPAGRESVGHRPGLLRLRLDRPGSPPPPVGPDRVGSADRYRRVEGGRRSDRHVPRHGALEGSSCIRRWPTARDLEDFVVPRHRASSAAGAASPLSGASALPPTPPLDADQRPPRVPSTRERLSPGASLRSNRSRVLTPNRSLSRPAPNSTSLPDLLGRRFVFESPEVSSLGPGREMGEPPRIRIGMVSDGRRTFRRHLGNAGEPIL